jgi:uncharacterized membrane protein YidH (DUF202 family)
MAIVRTSLSLIGFGFTINQVFRELAGRHVLAGGQTTGRRLGLALLALGILFLLLGIISHAWFFRDLMRRRRWLLDQHLLHGITPYNPTPTFVAAALLLALGIVTLAAITIGVLP